jgi:hypothetical protein
LVHDLTTAVDDLLIDAYVEVEQRLLALAHTYTNRRGRITERWLGRWSTRIGAELRRRTDVRNEKIQEVINQ